VIRQIKYLNDIVEQDHQAIKRLIRPMLGFKLLRSAAATLAGIELMHMIRKGQLLPTGKVRPSATILFASRIDPVTIRGLACPPGNLRHLWTPPQKQGKSSGTTDA
jgi:DDE domain